MSFDPVDDVQKFLDKFEVPRRLDPGWPTEDVIEFRLRHLGEELEEIIEAVSERNMENFADGLIDLVYLAIGTCLVCGISFRRVWQEVQNANMRKERAASDGSNSKRGHGHDVVKPAGWRPPDVHGALYGYRTALDVIQDWRRSLRDGDTEIAAEMDALLARADFEHFAKCFRVGRLPKIKEVAAGVERIEKEPTGGGRGLEQGGSDF